MSASRAAQASETVVVRSRPNLEIDSRDGNRKISNMEVDDDTSSSGSSIEDEDDDDNDKEEEDDDENDAEAEDDSNMNGKDITDNSTTPLQSIRTRPREIQPNNDLKARLASFLPQIRQANKILDDDEDVQSRRIDQVTDGEVYVEMDLALGVLKKRRQEGDLSNANEIRTADSSDEEGEGNGYKNVEADDEMASSSVVDRPDGQKKNMIQEL